MNSDDISLFIDLNGKISNFYYSADTWLEITVDAEDIDDKLDIMSKIVDNVIFPKSFELKRKRELTTYCSYIWSSKGRTIQIKVEIK